MPRLSQASLMPARSLLTGLPYTTMAIQGPGTCDLAVNWQTLGSPGKAHTLIHEGLAGTSVGTSWGA